MSTKWISTDQMSGALRPDIPLFWLFYFVIDLVSKISYLVYKNQKNTYIKNFNVTYFALEFTKTEVVLKLFLIKPSVKKL